MNVGFLAASIMFYSTMSTQAVVIADWIFIIGSLIAVAFAAVQVHESHALEHLSEMTQLTGLKSRRLRNEFMEHMLFAVASFIFFLGSIFFMPGIYGENEEAERTGQAYGSRLFIAGSFMLVMASFFAAVGMAADPAHQHFKQGSQNLKCHYIFIAGLACSQLASVCFVSGSVLFRPVFSYGKPLAGDVGVDFYVVGSMLYVLESFLGLWVLLIKHSSSFAGNVEDVAVQHDAAAGS